MTDLKQEDMKKIEALTPEQEAYLPIFRQKFLDIACGGGRTDRALLSAAMADAYAEIGKPPPALFVFDSPAACMLAIKRFEMGDDPKFKPDDQLHDQLHAQLLDQLHAQLLDQLRDRLGGQLLNQLSGQLFNQLHDQLGGQLLHQLFLQLRDQSIWNMNFLWGSHDLYWVARALFGEHIGVQFSADTSRRLHIMARIGEQCEWWWPFENVVIASQRATLVKWDDGRCLHSENGPAVEYADGYSLALWHGVRIPLDWIENRETIDPAIILGNRDVEKRAAGLACIGYERAFDQLNGRVIHDSGSREIGELVEITIPGLPQPGRFLRAWCPRNGQIFEGVPTSSEINTAYAAQAWREGLTVEEWAPPPVRT